MSDLISLFVSYTFSKSLMGLSRLRLNKFPSTGSRGGPGGKLLGL